MPKGIKIQDLAPSDAPNPSAALLGDFTPEQFLELSDSKASDLTRLVNEQRKRESQYANLAMVCGTISLLTCVIAFAYLALQGHKEEAYVILGTAVLAMIGQIIKSRL